jgi:hypothetical protein
MIIIIKHLEGKVIKEFLIKINELIKSQLADKASTCFWEIEKKGPFLQIDVFLECYEDKLLFLSGAASNNHSFGVLTDYFGFCVGLLEVSPVFLC